MQYRAMTLKMHLFIAQASKMAIDLFLPLSGQILFKSSPPPPTPPPPTASTQSYYFGVVAYRMFDCI